MGEVVGDAVFAAALLDHLLHHAVVIQIEGSSYRLRQHADLPSTSERKRSAGDGLGDFGQREEGLSPEPPENAALGEAHASFDLTLVPWAPWPSRQIPAPVLLLNDHDLSRARVADPSAIPTDGWPEIDRDLAGCLSEIAAHRRHALVDLNMNLLK